MLRFYIWFILTVYYKMRQILLQDATAILLQNATEIYYKMRQDLHYKMRQFHYKMRQLLQIATFITNCDSTSCLDKVVWEFLQHSHCRSSRPEVQFKQIVPKNFPKFTGKHLCQSFFYSKVTDTFFIDHLWWLLLLLAFFSCALS